jgi:hypothetical protein
VNIGRLPGQEFDIVRLNTAALGPQVGRLVIAGPVIDHRIDDPIDVPHLENLWLRARRAAILASDNIAPSGDPS